MPTFLLAIALLASCMGSYLAGTAWDRGDRLTRAAGWGVLGASTAVLAVLLLALDGACGLGGPILEDDTVRALALLHVLTTLPSCMEAVGHTCSTSWIRLRDGDGPIATSAKVIAFTAVFVAVNLAGGPASVCFNAGRRSAPARGLPA